MIIKKNKAGKWVLALVFISTISFNAIMTAQTHRAFLVGINNYEPKEPLKESLCRKIWKNLCGCINDVEAIKGILISRFYFEPENIHALKNEEATRDNILSGIETHLIKEAVPGDVCVFYFAGHGSRVKNSMSNEPDKKDETLVPADWYRGAGDIRDKELKKLFNRVLDKKANLTVIVDACHSGSISRGVPVYRHYRFLPENNCDVADPPDNEKTPAERGALIISAAGDFQTAAEIEDENGNCYGLFTWALVKVLRSVPPDESTANILLRVNALMQSEGIKHRVSLNTPNVEVLFELRKKPLFGSKPGKDFGIAVGVVEVRGKRIKLLAGFAAGIRKNCELQKIPGNSKKSTVKVRVTRVYGLNLCEAEVIQGDAAGIKIGDLFEIDRWVASPEARMNVWIPESNFSYKDLTSIAGEIARLQNSAGIEWVDDPTERDPTHIMSWHQSHWCLETRGSKGIKLRKRPKADLILKKIMSSCPAEVKKPCFFLQLPLSTGIQKIILSEIQYFKDSIKRLPSDRDAQYILVGRLNKEVIEYAWVLPNICREQGKANAMPMRTRWIANGKDELTTLRAANDLRKDLLRLVKVRAWQQLSSPPDNGDFPYRLVLKNTKTGEIKTMGPLMEGERYGLVLRTYKEKPGKEIDERYVYVFFIDSYGKGQLLFPHRNRRNSENRFPASDEFQAEIQLGGRKSFRITAPFGVDTYFLLTTEEAITNLEVLDFKGVRREPYKVQRYTPLERLLYGLDSGDRGRPPVTHKNWSIQRLPILSISRKQR